MNPYIGPRSFSYADRDRFFGREEEGRDLFSLVLSQRLVLFYAPSGAGKSSLVNTSLIPMLTEAGMAVLPLGRLSGSKAVAVPIKNNFVFNLLQSLDRQSSPESLAHLSLSEFLAHLVSEDGLSYHYDAAAESLPENDYEAARSILIIDQFEEIFTTQTHHWAERADFFDQLEEAMQHDPLLWVVLSLRQDYVAQLDPYAKHLSNHFRARFYMERMSAEAALAAITQPTRQTNRTFAAGVAEQLVVNLSQIKLLGAGETTVTGEFIEPVQLQVVCYRLWEALPATAKTITPETLSEFGDVNQALAQFYEQVVAEILLHGMVDEIVLRNWFDEELITEARTRGTVYQSDKSTGSLPNAVVAALVEKFILRAEIRAGGTWFELVHDRFIEPILQANLTWRQKQPLLQLAQAWADSQRAPSNLLEGAALDEALATNWPGLGELVKQYIEASQQLQANKERLAAEARYRLEQETKLKEAEEAQRLQEVKLQAEEARRAEIEEYNQKLRLRARWLAGSLAFALFMAMVAGVFGYIAQQNATLAIKSKEAAEIARIEALKSQTTAEAASTEAIKSEYLANDEREKAIKARNTANAERQDAIKLRDDLANNLATELARKIAVVNVTPQIILTVEIVETPTFDFGATATVNALQTQLAEVQAKQTVIARPYINMVTIRAGEFIMGSSQAQVDATFEECTKALGITNCQKERFEDQMPQHTVYLADYSIDKYEVTNAQYATCVRVGDCVPPHEIKSFTHESYYDNPQFVSYPVIYVDWFQAKTYCEWQGKRLPTEAEWEKAARGIDGRTYPWGNQSPDDKLLNYNGNVGDTTEVGHYLNGASVYGVMDMAGNVWEWTSSNYQPYPYKANDGRENGNNTNDKVLRGGAWPAKLDGIISAPNRSNPNDPFSYNYNLGFRCAKDAVVPAVTPQPTPPPPPTPTPRPAVNLIATQTAIAQTTREAEISASCPNGPNGEFQSLWATYKTRLGCPKQLDPTIYGNFAEQKFDNGFMFWSEVYKDKFIIAINITSPPKWYPVTWTGQSCPEAANSKFPLNNAMLWGWCENPAIRESLGQPTEVEQSTSAAMQEFENGIMLRVGDNLQNVYLLFQDDQSVIYEQGN